MLSQPLPNDPSESVGVDTDSDGIGNNADSDDDNDGVLDSDKIAYTDLIPVTVTGDHH